MIDRNTGKSRGFGFLYFHDVQGQDDAIKDMHNNELEGRRISVVKAVPMDQTKPGTPAGVLGGGLGSRSTYNDRGPRGGDRDRGGYDRDRNERSYDRGYDRDRGFDRGVDRYGGGDRGGYGGGDGGGGYGAPSYPRDPYPPRGPAYGPPGGYGAPPPYQGGYDRGFESYGPDRSRPTPYGGPPRSGPYDRPYEDRRPR